MKGRKFNLMSKAPKPTKVKKPKAPVSFLGKETPEEESAEEMMPPVMGGKSRMRLDRPGRKRGGSCGGEMRPLSMAGKKAK